MALTDRPYIGTWGAPADSVDNAPDAILEINGSTIITACARCGAKVDINQYVIEISTEAGVEPGGASASFTLSLPPHLASKDGKTLIPLGAEVEIYMRGFFPVRGLFSDVAPGSGAGASGVGTRISASPASSPSAPVGAAAPATPSAEVGTGPPPPGSRPEDNIIIQDQGDTFKGFARKYAPTQIVIHESQTESADETVSVLQNRGLSVHYTVDQDGSIRRLLDDSRRGSQVRGNNARSIGMEITNPLYGKEALPGQQVIQASWAHTGSYAVPPADQMEASWGLTRRIAADNDIPIQFAGESGDTFRMTQASRDSVSQPGIMSHEQWGDHADGSFPALYMAIRNRGYTPDDAYSQAVDLSQKGAVVSLPPRVAEAAAAPAAAAATDKGPDAPIAEAPLRDSTPGTDIVSYPYYHVFRGVVVDANESQQEGSATLSVQCQSLLHFWQYEVVSANASLIASRPSASGLKSTLLGHNFVGRHPYQIIYELHQDILGAAAGVDWTLSQKTNRDAASEAGQFFSLTRQYWAERFSRRAVKLRMHGLHGDLFSAMQSAFLARTPTEELRDVLRERDGSARLRRQRGTGLMSQAATLGLLTTPKSDQPPGVRSPVELNIAEMTAFVSNIGSWGQVNLFESAYESKLDVVHKVCEVTGFEFFQDVDGDFVFKPPLYNLDTSGSRAYRLEPEDIISMSIQDHEPQVTYATVRGSQFHNLQGHGVEGELGVQGQYIDFRLVAQYGWRPEDVETAYLTDPRSAFYLAASRVDMSAAHATAASATIPLRPEIRPGYPFYNSVLDCYYYCRGISHSWVVGGQCSTNLALVARREAFHAPGISGSPTRGVGALDLGNGALPPRPLVASTSDGDIRVVGFPNVIMALDPDHLDPSVLRLGGGFDRIDDPLVLRSLLETAVLRRVASRTQDGGYAVDVSDGKGGSRRVVFSLSGGQAGTVDAQKAAKQLAAQRSATTAERSKLEQQLRDAEAEASRPAGPAGAPDYQKASKTVADLRSRLRAMDAQAVTQDQGSDAGLLFQALQRVAEADLVPTTPGDQKGSRALALLRVVSDKKGSFLSDKLPGYYRYYSASHPSPEQQGPPSTSIELGPDGKTSVTRSPAMLDPKYAGTQVLGFLPAKTGRAEVDQTQVRPSRGVRLLMADPSRPTGMVVPTSSVLEVSFSALDLWAGVPSRSDVPVYTSSGDEAAYVRFAQGLLAADAAAAAAGQSAQAVFLNSWTTLQAEVVYAWVAAQASSGVKDLPTLQPPPFPSQVSVGSPVVSATAPYDWTPAAAAAAASALAVSFAAMLSTAVELWVDALEVQGVSGAAVEQLRSALTSYLRSRFGVAGSSGTRSAVTGSDRKRDLVECPVFPVSDAKGYRVVGAFRYGRGLDVAADGAWAALRRQDPLSMLDRASVERILDEVVQAGQSPDASLATEIARQLRGSFTDTQLLDFGLARKKPGADMLEIGLLNWFADGREGVAKVPVQNTAVALSQMSLAGIGSAPAVCACTTADLDFPNLSTDADAAAISQALAARADQATPSWRAAQDSVRGAKTPSKTSLSDSLAGAASSLTSIGNQVSADAAAVAAGAQTLSRGTSG